ncbi:MAG: hypothetical protein GXZ08_07415 [Tissierellia bacterium]|nr:hypothetical protein [Tissierellia bacterium]
MNYLILLTGCGLGDGSAIEEAICTYISLDKYNINYTPIAENIEKPSVNHYNNLESEYRNLLIESARIGRGKIANIKDIDIKEFDGLIIIGGLGIIKNTIDSEELEDMINFFIESNKPVGAMCAAIDFLNRYYDMSSIKSIAKTLKQSEAYHDVNANIFYTPAFRAGANLFEIQKGIDEIVYLMISN